jgi:hypothetical protein
MAEIWMIIRDRVDTQDKKIKCNIIKNVLQSTTSGTFNIYAPRGKIIFPPFPLTKKKINIYI